MQEFDKASNVHKLKQFHKLNHGSEVKCMIILQKFQFVIFEGQQSGSAAVTLVCPMQGTILAHIVFMLQ